MEFDDIVIGAGSAGSVLATRLSEEPGRKVLLVEAGPDYENTEDVPRELYEPHEAVLKGHNWDFQAIVREPSLAATIRDAGRVFSASSNRSRLSIAKSAIKSPMKGKELLTHFEYPVGRVTGGSSAVNGCLAMRGTAEDYDAWAQQGNPIWRWSNIEKLFQRIEAGGNHNEAGGNHNSEEYTGLIPVQRTAFDDLHTMQRSFYDVCQGLGYPQCKDLNKDGATGIGIIPRNIRNNQRVSTAMAYLSIARHRSNFELSADTLVKRILLKNTKAVGIEAVINGSVQKIFAKRITLSAGAVNTPCLLMRSGIGNSKSLEALDIEPSIHLSGVGQNLSDHASVGIWATPDAGLCRHGEDLHQVLLRYSSQETDDPNDMQIYMLNSINTEQFPGLKMVLGSDLAASVAVILGKPYSKGRIELESNDVLAVPKIYLNCASDDRDMIRLMEGVRKAWQIIRSSPLEKQIARIFAWNDKIIESDQRLRETITTFVRTSWHPTGTARMGPDSDPMAVVNQYGGVHGCEGLFVADASIMPSIPRVPTNLTCMMIGEQIASQFKHRETTASMSLAVS